ncbi:hypothetical protein [Variovorax arabinosiphilus]|uniref:hypothetical protein n=1 Tax=Variovorax arabinosiphilus TaxID=3053498 RepID=UPI0025749375|nr:MULTISPECIES: hypothetical protein [unclassified Variovorax]MDM0121426.1 hypothetical protein [Variovorax sp. J2L1-78]MDM0130487.1 hypothetical protein [Variovorax sp. J2L1-63]MDM0234189.1 hypothetical protein [Variovorax sp. J2R1-6]
MSTYTAVRLSFAKRKQGGSTAHVRVAGRGSIFEPLRTRGPRPSDIHAAAVLAEREASDAEAFKAIVLSVLDVRWR